MHYHNIHRCSILDNEQSNQCLLSRFFHNDTNIPIADSIFGVALYHNSLNYNLMIIIIQRDISYITKYVIRYTILLNTSNM